ncbi:MAG: HDOD domain-containing protein, partial [Deltaproteobacteria bacterium]|nr:HDOD domain-containing protein [Deltaproteobacteria bacterium]
VGVSLFDRHALITGLIHIVLPRGSKEKEALFPARYASTGIPLLLTEMIGHGASRENIVAEIVGGALMLTNQKLNVDMNIGRRNSDSARETLAREGIPALNRVIGGCSGRVFRLDPNSGKTFIRYAGEKTSRGGPPPVGLEKIDPEAFVKGIEGLKPIPEKARRVISLIEFSYGYSPAHLERYVLKDPAICANVLKMCNSDQPGFGYRVQSVSDATSLLGLDALKDIVLAASTYKLYNDAPKGYSTEEGDHLSRHAVCCAMVARLLADRKGLGDPALFFTAGLLHDIGKLILDQYAFEKFNLVMDRVVHEAKTSIEVEDEMLGCNHTQIGGIAAMEWGLPQALVAAISFHHTPEKAFESPELVSVVHIADIICAMFGAGAGVSVLAGPLHQYALSVLDLKPEDVDGIIEQLPDVVKKVDAE